MKLGIICLKNTALKSRRIKVNDKISVPTLLRFEQELNVLFILLYNCRIDYS